MVHRRGYLWFAAGLVLAAAAGLITYVAVQRTTAVERAPQVPAPLQVLVATRDIPLHTLVAETDVALREVPATLALDGSLSHPREAVGHLTTADIRRGEQLLRERLITPDYVGPRAAFAMEPQKVMVAFPAQDLLNTAGIVRPADRVDLLFSLDFSRVKPDIPPGLNTMCLLQDLQVADVVYAEPSDEGRASPPLPSGLATTDRGPAQAILLAVDPQDALAVKFFRDAGAAPDLVLRSPAAEGLFELVPVDGDYVLQHYRMRWWAAQ
mgnify:CR=1 FL=1